MTRQIRCVYSLGEADPAKPAFRNASLNVRNCALVSISTAKLSSTGCMTNSIRFPHPGQQSALCGDFTGRTAVPEAEGMGGEGTAGEEDGQARATWEGSDPRGSSAR